MFGLLKIFQISFSLLSVFFFIEFCRLEPVAADNSFELNRTTYSAGDKIFFTIHLEKDFFVYLLNESSDGTIHLLFPNPDDSANKFSAGDYKLPSSKSNYEFQVDNDPGKEKFYLILSQKKIAKLHERNFRDSESLHGQNWLRKITSDLLPMEWKIYEKEVQVFEN